MLTPFFAVSMELLDSETALEEPLQECLPRGLTLDDIVDVYTTMAGTHIHVNGIPSNGEIPCINKVTDALTGTSMLYIMEKDGIPWLVAYTYENI